MPRGVDELPKSSICAEIETKFDQNSKKYGKRYSAIEFGELIDGVVAHEGLADEEDEVGVVDADELGERLHQGLIVLHATGGID